MLVIQTIVVTTPDGSSRAYEFVGTLERALAYYDPFNGPDAMECRHVWGYCE